MTDLPDSLLPIGVGLCLSAACGFRTFLPLLFVGAASRWGIVPLNGQFEWLASTPGLVVLLSATVAEIVAYFVPFVDNASDVIATPLAIGAGTLMMLTSLGDSSGVIPWALAIILGGGTSGIVQAATVKLRALSSGTTAGTGNAVVAGGELVSASTFSLVALFLPVIAFVVALILLVIVVRVLMRVGKRVRGRGAPSA
ncbi:MAG: DUF4126 domain-containing protein [Gemmatimonadota bacterium]